jgi:hypothetical protein
VHGPIKVVRAGGLTPNGNVSVPGETFAAILLQRAMYINFSCLHVLFIEHDRVYLSEISRYRSVTFLDQGLNSNGQRKKTTSVAVVQDSKKVLEASESF